MRRGCTKFLAQLTSRVQPDFRKARSSTAAMANSRIALMTVRNIRVGGLQNGFAFNRQSKIDSDLHLNLDFLDPNRGKLEMWLFADWLPRGDCEFVRRAAMIVVGLIPITIVKRHKHMPFNELAKTNLRPDATSP